jgi:hypothetical protein
MTDRDDFAAAAWAVMSGSRYYDVYDVQGEAEAICRWLCEEESGDIWRVVPLVPCDATPELHATSDECSVHPEGTQPVAWAVAHRGSIVHVAIGSHEAQEWAGGGPVDVVPLYRSPTLTDEEREAIEEAMRQVVESDCIATPHALEVIDTLRGLLERTK